MYSDFSDSDPEADDVDKDSAEQYRAVRKAQRQLASSRRGPDSDEFGPGVKGGSVYSHKGGSVYSHKGGSVYSHQSRGGSVAGKDSIFDEADGLLIKVISLCSS